MFETGQSRRRGWVLALAILAAAAGGAVTAGAQQGPGPAGPGAKPQGLLTPEDREAIGQIFWNRMQERLGLNEQQVSDIRTLLQDRRNAARADVQALFTARKQLRELLGQPNADPAAIQSAAAQVKGLQDKLFDQRLQTQLAIRSKLTPDQLAKWVELRGAMGQRWMGRSRGPASTWQ